MRDTLAEILRNMGWSRNRKNRLSAVLLVLSLLVSLDVFWMLRQPGLTLAGNASCGILEHTHTDTCGSRVCVCQISEEPHSHDASCYETRSVEAQELRYIVCEVTEEPHTHDESCYETSVTELTTQTVLVCENEDEGHSHDDTCYETIETGGEEESVLICSLLYEPHQHTDICFETEVIEASEEQILICDRSERVHSHEDTCYEWEMTCEYEEHVHTIDCYSDNTADTETLLDWQEMFANYPYTGDLRSDLVGIAQTQVGYTESTRNFEVGRDGVRRGYTRYGAWYGTPYRDWSAMFVSFCLHYAGANPEETPGNTGASSMAQAWKNNGRYVPCGDYIPLAGDLVFFDNKTVGIVIQVQNATFYVIRGDVDDTVCSEVLSLADASITGWGLTVGTVPEAEENFNTEEQAKDIFQEEQQLPPTQVGAEDILDISCGPAFFIFEGGESVPQMKRFSLRSTRSVIELLPYLEANGGSYFFTLLDFENVELPKDEDGNYIAVANEGYKMTITFNSPEGFLPGTYQYQVPNGLMVDGGEGSFILNGGTAGEINVGSWAVTDTGLITLVFNDHMDSHSEITISATLGIHFPEQQDPIDFDGLITVKVEPPPEQESPTELSKWGSPNSDAGKINWTIRIDGHADSQIPGNILTDQAMLSDWSRPHSYTESDIAGGITFGVSDPDGGWHAWTVSVDDPRLIWEETGWSYKMPKTVSCDYCGELELGNDGWIYLINYTSTPTPLNTPGTFDYENKATIDGQTAWGWSNFTHGAALAEIVKNGSFVSDAGNGTFLWEFQATIPGRIEGQRADYAWFIMDEMRLLDENGSTIGRVQNDANLAKVIATYNGTTIEIPRIQDATDEDMFAWDNSWTATENGISYNRTLNLLCRCQCTPETCHWSGCENYWFQRDDGTWAANGFCQCWTETQNMVFTFVYRTKDMSMIQGYGPLGYQVNNHVQLYHSPAGQAVRVSYDDAIVPIPNLFEKQLTHDFDGYTANYKITVNESKLSLTDGSPLCIRDVMTKTLAYISGSLVITAEDANGNTTTLTQDTDFTVTYDGTGNQTDGKGNEVHVLDIVILHPQPVMYTLDYDTTLIMPEQITSGIKYSNYAEITLWGENIKDNAVEKVYADINIAAKSYKVKLFKTSAQTGEPLGGATFGLYNTEGGLISTEVTNADGELLFQTSIVEGIILREHTLYYMQELRAPPGYQLDDTKHWFCFCGTWAASCATCDKILASADAVRIPFEQIGTVNVANQIMNYDLPATGGPGIYPLILVSVMFIVTPLVYGFVLRRKQGRRGAG